MASGLPMPRDEGPSETAISLESNRRSDLTLAATLISLFDFNADGEVTHEEWERGLGTLLLGGLAADQSLWNQLLNRYDPFNRGTVQLDRVREVLPIDPRISVLMQQLVHSVAGCREYVAAATKKQQRDIEMKSQRAVINLRKRLLQPIFSAWLEAIRTDKKLRRRAARFMVNSAVGKAWRTWLGVCDNAHVVDKKRQRMAKMLRRMQSRGVSRALNQWIEVWDATTRLRKFGNKMVNAGVSRAWNQWAALAAEHMRLKRFMSRALNPDLTRGFQAIMTSAEEARRMRRIGQRALGGPLMRAWNTWLDSLGSMKRMARFMRRAMNRGLSKAWERWFEFLEERERMIKFGKKMLNRDVQRGWSSWMGMLQERARVKAIASRMMSVGISRGWNAWVSLGADLEARKAEMRKVMARGLHGRLAKAMNQWISVSEASAWLRKQAQTILSGGLGRAWRAWLEMIDERERQLKLIRRALSGGLLRGFNKWVANFDEFKRLKSLANRTMGSGSAMVWALNKWLEYIELNEALAGVARKALNGSLTRAFNTWCDGLGDRHKMARFLRRAKNRGLAKAWDRWLELLDEIAMLQKFGRKILNHSVQKAWMSWLEMLDEKERMKVFMNRLLQAGVVKAWNQWEDACFRFKRLKRFGSKLMNRAASRAFEQWLDSIEDLRRKQRFGRRWRNAGLARAFQTWLAMCEQRDHAKKLASRVVARMTGDLLSMCFQAWADHTSSEMEHRRELKRKGINMMRNRLLEMTFSSWKTVVGEEERRQAKMLPFANMLANRHLTVSFNAWRDFVEEKTGLRKRYAAKIAKTLLAKCFGAWASIVDAANEKDTEQRRRAHEAVQRMRMNAVVQVYQAWRDYVVEAHAAMGKAVARWEGAALGPAYRTWCAFAEDRKRFLELGRKMIARYHNKLLATVFLAWAGLLQANASEKARAMALMSGKAELMLQVYFEMWRDEVRATVDRRAELSLKMYSRYLNQALTKCFLAWAAEAGLGKRGSLEKALAFLSGRQELFLRLYWDAFRNAVAQKQADREAIVQDALMRMRHGLLHLVMTQWRDATSGGKPRAPGGGTLAEDLLATTQSLSQAIEELKVAESTREVAAEATVMDNARQNEATQARLSAIEKQLSQTTKMLARTEKLLAPLPAAAVDQAAYAMMRNEVERLEQTLALTQHQLASMQMTKAQRSEIAEIRGSVSRFLFGTQPPPPPKPPPLPPSVPTSLPPASALPLLAMEVERRAEAAFQQKVEREGRSTAFAAPARDSLAMAYAPTVALPTPPMDPRPASSRRPRPNANVNARPQTARSPLGFAPGLGVVTGPVTVGDRRPASARAPAGSSPYEPYGDSATVSAAAAAAVAAGDAARLAAAAAFSKAAMGGAKAPAEKVETVEITQLFEERRLSARRSAGARTTAGASRPPTANTGRPLTPRGQMAGARPRLPEVGQ